MPSRGLKALHKTMAKKKMALGIVLVLTMAGWTGFQVVAQTDRIPGRALAITLSPLAPLEFPHEVTFAVVGDAGTGGKNQFRVAEVMAQTYRRQPFSVLLTTGDNVYYGDVVDRARDVIEKPYGPLFDAGVSFRPVVGNHDVDDPEDLPGVLTTLGMPDRYYQFTSGPVDFFALDSNQMDSDQLGWLMDGLSCSDSLWQVVYSHHPLYSSGKHGSDAALREKLEPILVAGGADIVFAGHDHDYERTLPQHGIIYVVTGGGGSRLRPVGSSSFTAVSESEHHFVLVKVAEATMQVTAFDNDSERLDDFAISPRAAQSPCTEGGRPGLLALPPHRHHGP